LALSWSKQDPTLDYRQTARRLWIFRRNKNKRIHNNERWPLNPDEGSAVWARGLDAHILESYHDGFIPSRRNFGIEFMTAKPQASRYQHCRIVLNHHRYRGKDFEHRRTISIGRRTDLRISSAPMNVSRKMRKGGPTMPESEAVNDMTSLAEPWCHPICVASGP
jgi:hypothetical protein